MLGLLSLTTVKEWLWAGIVVAMGLLALHIYHAGERHEIAALAAQSAKLQAKAQEDIHNQQIAYDKQLTEVEDKLNAQLQNARALRLSDAQRLRDFDAYRRLHPEVAGAPGGSSTGGSGTSGVDSGTDSVSRLERVAAELADATRTAAAALGACVNERNSLTGK